ncbi:MAG: Lrp/AsnC family transcriptional regulator [Peptococcaceae bacterium]|nr:Lrp/AsnC family transcriptional regulator [Peptococcaceae bacterium]
MLTPADIKIIKELQKGLPLVGRPYLQIAENIGLSEEEVLARIKNLKNRGMIRRIAGSVRHRKLGFSANAMVVWIVPEADLARVGKLFAGNEQVSHCYERETNDKWKYNLYTMIHGGSREECFEISHNMAEASGVMEYKLLFSTKEFKKTSMKYFE